MIFVNFTKSGVYELICQWQVDVVLLKEASQKLAQFLYVKHFILVVIEFLEVLVKLFFESPVRSVECVKLGEGASELTILEIWEINHKL